MKRSAISSLILFVLLAVTVSPVLAQQDVAGLINRISRLERELSDLQRSVYAGSASPRAEAGASSKGPAIDQTTLGSSGGAPTALARIEVKIQRFEADLRALTGRVEELGFELSRTNDRLDRVQTDTDQRFRELTPETGSLVPDTDATNQPASAARSSLAPAVTAPSPTVAAPPPGQPGTLGTLTSSDIASLQSGGAPDAAVTAKASGAEPSSPTASAPASSVTGATPAQTASVSPADTTEQQYRSAFDYLVKHDYDRAQVAFQSFVQINPDDPLAGNAQYWLGETYYVRERYQEAAVTFLEGYQTYPKSPKAADNLLKLGMALARIDRKDEACATFDKLQADFPQAPTNIRRRMSQELERLQCGG